MTTESARQSTADPATEGAPGPLAGIRVLEFSQIVATPVCGVNLSDLGAEVIKVEPPGGEQTRRSGGLIQDESKGFQALNRGKRSLVVDLQDERGRVLIHRLIPDIDVVTINYRLGVADRLDIDYETLRGIRPDLIYWQNTGFGEGGPEAGRAGSDIVAQAYSGLMVTDGKTDDDGAPELISTPIADITSGVVAAMGICAALYHRAQTGEGQYIGTSLLRTGLALQSGSVMREPVTDAVLRDQFMASIDGVRDNGGSYDEILATRRSHLTARVAFRNYYGGYRAKEGAVVLGALTKANRDAMRAVLGVEGDGSDQPGYDARDPENVARAWELKAWLRQRFLTRTATEWVADLDAAGAPVAPVHLPEELADDPQVAADEMIWDLEHTVTGPQRVVGPWLTMSQSPTRAYRPAPALGEHSADLLHEAGLPHSEVEKLRAEGVIVQRGGVST
jgi:crotonobetainyl-CoA:carnitine CoA-transferase CaiB-like acyl-CoA transferase